jgi:hypothetical protein
LFTFVLNLGSNLVSILYPTFSINIDMHGNPFVTISLFPQAPSHHQPLYES